MRFVKFSVIGAYHEKLIKNWTDKLVEKVKNYFILVVKKIYIYLNLIATLLKFLLKFIIYLFFG